VLGLSAGVSGRARLSRPGAFGEEYETHWVWVLPRRSANSDPARGNAMNQYLLEGVYTTDSWRAMIANPQNRGEILRDAVMDLGGEVVASFMCSGEYDVVVLLRLPDDITRLAASIALKGHGGLANTRWTRLFSWTEAMGAMEVAGSSSYRPPDLEVPVSEPEGRT
jgi:uncharacterized protein with GYD domain